VTVFNLARLTFNIVQAVRRVASQPATDILAHTTSGPSLTLAQQAPSLSASFPSGSLRSPLGGGSTVHDPYLHHTSYRSVQPLTDVPTLTYPTHSAHGPQQYLPNYNPIATSLMEPPASQGDYGALTSAVDRLSLETNTTFGDGSFGTKYSDARSEHGPSGTTHGTSETLREGLRPMENDPQVAYVTQAPWAGHDHGDTHRRFGRVSRNSSMSVSEGSQAAAGLPRTSHGSSRAPWADENLPNPHDFSGEPRPGSESRDSPWVHDSNTSLQAPSGRRAVRTPALIDHVGGIWQEAREGAQADSQDAAGEGHTGLRIVHPSPSVDHVENILHDGPGGSGAASPFGSKSYAAYSTSSRLTSPSGARPFSPGMVSRAIAAAQRVGAGAKDCLTWGA
jgi:hypothetical protein